MVQQWRDEDSYPYEGEPAGPAEVAERDLFEVIAVAAAPTISSISSRKARGLTLRLLCEALASDPGRLRHVLDQVLDMPSQDLDDLHSLLQQTVGRLAGRAGRRHRPRRDVLCRNASRMH